MIRLGLACSLLGGCLGTNGSVLTPADSAADPDAPDATGDGPPQPWRLVTSVTTVNLYGVSGTSSSDVTAVGGVYRALPIDPGITVRWDGTNWSAAENLILLYATHGSLAAGEYGGEGSVTRWNGSTWSSREVLAPVTLRGTWDTSNGTYVVGDGGRLLFDSKLTDLGWRSLTSNTATDLRAIWGSSSTDVYAVGEGGVILHNGSAGLDGSGQWTSTIVASSTLTGVWGSSANDVYVVGEAPAVILHSTNRGMTWTAMEPPGSSLGLSAIAGRSATDIYAVGASGGVIFHSSGGDVWTSQSSPTTKDLFGVWVASSGDAYAVGRDGTIVHKAP